MEEFEILDDDFNTQKSRLAVSFCDAPMFALLSICSMGIYPVWWIYKTWDYYKQKEALDIMPVWRAIFAIIWIYPLFEKIKSEGFKNGIQTNYLSGLLLIGVLVCNISSRLPGMYTMISLFAFVFYLQPSNLFNEILDQDEDVERINHNNFTQRRILLLILGILLWGMNLMLLYTEDGGVFGQ